MSEQQNKIPQKSDLNRLLIENNQLMICSKCNGTGSDPKHIKLNNKLNEIQKEWGRKEFEIVFVYCKKCHGIGCIDWIGNATGIANHEHWGADLTNIRNVAIIFLISALYGPELDFKYENFYDSVEDGYYISPEQINIELGIENYKDCKSVVSNYLSIEDVWNFGDIIDQAYIIDGQACINCFKLILDNELIPKIKKYDKLIPAMPDDQINYRGLIREGKDNPKFRLCDDCKKCLSEKEIIRLKKEGFENPSDTNFLPHDCHEDIFRQ